MPKKRVKTPVNELFEYCKKKMLREFLKEPVLPGYDATLAAFNLYSRALYNRLWEEIRKERAEEEARRLEQERLIVARYRLDEIDQMSGAALQPCLQDWVSTLKELGLQAIMALTSLLRRMESKQSFKQNVPRGISVSRRFRKQWRQEAFTGVKRPSWLPIAFTLGKRLN